MAYVSRLTLLALMLCAGALLAFRSEAAAVSCYDLGGVHPATNPHKYTFDGGAVGSCSASSSSSLVGGTHTLASLIAARSASPCFGVTGTCTINGISSCGTDTYQMSITGPTGLSKNQNFHAIPSASGDTCLPDPNDCATLANQQALGFASDQTAAFEPPEEVCIDMGSSIGRCAAFRRANLNDGTTKYPYSRNQASPTTFDYMWRNQFTGLNCVVETTGPAGAVPQDEGEVCVGAYCEGVDARPGCGWLNDKYICTPMDEGTCAVYPDGSRNCEGTAPTPPVPDNGTAGVPATPDESVDVCTGTDSCQTINNYDTVTVGGSARNPGGGTAPTDGPGSGSSGDGSGSSGDSGDGTGDGGGVEGSVTGGVSCADPPVCDGDPVQCAVLSQQWKARCPDPAEGDPVVDIGFTEGEIAGDISGGDDVDVGALNASGPLGAGSCPAPFNVTVWGTSVSIDVWQYGCDFATLFAPFVLAMGYLLGGLLLVRGIQ